MKLVVIREYDKYTSARAQGDCYRYVIKCPSCGEEIGSLTDYDFLRLGEKIKHPNFCQECGLKLKGLEVCGEKGGEDKKLTEFIGNIHDNPELLVTK